MDTARRKNIHTRYNKRNSSHHTHCYYFLLCGFNRDISGSSGSSSLLESASARVMTQIPPLRPSAEIFHVHRHGYHSDSPGFSVAIEKNSATDLKPEPASLNSFPIANQTIYKYLEWSTQLSELYPTPERLPPSVTKQTDPFTWDPKQKMIILVLGCFSTGMAAYSAGAYTSGLNQMLAEWDVSRVALLVGVTMFTTGFAVAPLFLAPLSEVSWLQD